MYRFEKQNWVSLLGEAHSGEVISGPFGKVGYIDWANEKETLSNIKTARLKIVSDKFAIFVPNTFRTTNMSAGTDLLRAVLLRTSEQGYQDFLILNAVYNALGFYEKAIQRLTNERIIKDSIIVPYPHVGMSDQNSIRLQL